MSREGDKHFSREGLGVVGLKFFPGEGGKQISRFYHPIFFRKKFAQIFQGSSDLSGGGGQKTLGGS